jgi:hypothetical protein
VPPKVKFFFVTSQFDGPFVQKRFFFFELLSIEGYILKYIVPPLWPSYIGERRITFAKAYGIKSWCYGEHVGDIFGTHWELKGNIV